MLILFYLYFLMVIPTLTIRIPIAFLTKEMSIKPLGTKVVKLSDSPFKFYYLIVVFTLMNLISIFAFYVITEDLISVYPGEWVR